MPEYAPPVNAFYTEIDVLNHVSPEKFIGREGFHLKRITELSRVDYIWLDFTRRVVEIWSHEERFLAKAVRMLKRRMDSFPVPEVTVSVTAGKAVIESWTEYPRMTYYTITGDEDACLKAFAGLITEYPHNPYFTKMVSKAKNPDGITVIRVSRSSTSD
jgi:hypothetical protein